MSHLGVIGLNRKEMKVLVILPVYNEEENLADIIKEILIFKKSKLDILIVNGNSNDGSLKIANSFKNENNRIFIKSYTRRYGRGKAVKAGFDFAIKNNYDYIIEMDADLSHRVEDISTLLRKCSLSNVDMVIGSRLIKNGEVKRNSIGRDLITKFGNIYLRWILGLKCVKDITSGFRCIRVKWLTGIDIEELKASGPQLLQEIIYKNKRRIKLAEMPVIFLGRNKGKSKFNIKIILKSIYLPIIWKIIDQYKVLGVK